MGIPRFFRWLAERYPLILQPLTSTTIPHIDNLYLDMNGIIHACTHNNNDDAITKALSKRDVVHAVFHYIDKLFNAIKPKRYFVMAVDGVAPRAKMNQQRSRRFRAAQDREQARHLAIRRGEPVPNEDDVFDSNCITPGTEFMADMSAHIQYFIRNKLETDLAWRDCQVIFSGHDVPGEGEHKIMEFIRGRKSQPDYSPNETHCLYGLDADLIMLSLVSHEPHFTLLREIVQFGKKPEDKKKKRTNSHNNNNAEESPPESNNGRRELKTLDDIVPPISQFVLLHISLLREYLDLEFNTLRLQFPDYSLERVIDDFVLLCFFIGNDFLPHLPTLDISDGALNHVFEIYKRGLPKWGGYLTDEGKIDFSRVEHMFSQLGKLEVSILNQRVRNRVRTSRRGQHFRDSGSRTRSEATDLTDFVDSNLFDMLEGEGAISGEEALEDDREMESAPLKEESDSHRRIHASNRLLVPPSETDVSSFEASRSAFEFSDYSDFEMDTDTRFLKPSPPAKRTGKSTSRGSSTKEGWEDVLLKSLNSSGDVNFSLYRRNYYNDKLHISVDDPEQMRPLVKNYIEGIVWVYNYYYRGCISWKWFYSHHYAPFPSDLKDLASIASEIKFELATPFSPFQQLMGVLPSKSSQCLPVPYRTLMWNQNSPIIDFYPSEFVVDREGTKSEWEGISLLPFIEEGRLLEAMGTVTPSQLTAEEKFRNRSGNCLLFRWNPAETPYFFESSLPGVLPPIPACHCNVSNFTMPDGSHFKPRLMKGVVLPEGLIPPDQTVINVDGLEGYPSFHTKPFESELRAIHLNLFGTLSKQETCVIKVLDEGISGDDIGKLVGTHIHVHWPYPREAIVSSIAGLDESFYQAGHTGGVYEKEVHSHFDRANFSKEASMHQNLLLSRKGLDVGEIRYLVFVRLFEGFKKMPNGTIIKKFDENELPFPLQLCLFNFKPLMTPSSLSRKGREEYHRNDEIVFLGDNYHGSRGTVVDIRQVPPPQFTSVTLSLTVPLNEPNVMSVLDNSNLKDDMDLKWVNISRVAQILNISTSVLSKITGSLRVLRQSGAIAELGLMIKLSKKNMCVKGFARKLMFASSNNEASYYMNPSMESGPSSDSLSAPRFLDRNNKFAVDPRDGVWELSDKAIQILQEYQLRFPFFWDQIQHIHFLGDPSATALFPSGDAEQQIQAIQDWLSSLPTRGIPLTPADVDVLPQSVVSSLEKLLNQYEADPISMEQARITLGNVSTYLVYNPRDPVFVLPKGEEPLITSPGDRVVNLSGSGLVPFGLRGTVIGRRGEMAHVMFDTQFLGGLKYAGGDSNRCALVQESTLLNLSEAFIHTQAKPPTVISIVYENLAQQRPVLATPIHRQLKWVARASKQPTAQSPMTLSSKFSVSAPAITSTVAAVPSQPAVASSAAQSPAKPEQVRSRPPQQRQQQQAVPSNITATAAVPSPASRGRVEPEETGSQQKREAPSPNLKKTKKQREVGAEADRSIAASSPSLASDATGLPSEQLQHQSQQIALQQQEMKKFQAEISSKFETLEKKFQQLQKEQLDRDKQHQDQMERMMNRMVNQTLQAITKQTEAAMAKAIETRLMPELADRLVRAAGPSIVTPLSDALTQGLNTSTLPRVEQSIQNHAGEHLHIPVSLPATISANIREPVQEAVSECFKTSLIPLLQHSCLDMASQFGQSLEKSTHK